MPSSGKLRERCYFQARATADDGAGGTFGPWAPLFGSRACRLAPRTASGATAEVVIAQRLQGINLFDLWVRYDSQTNTVTTDHRAVDARDPSRCFNIRAITNVDEKRRWLTMVVEAGVADG